MTAFIQPLYGLPTRNNMGIVSSGPPAKRLKASPTVWQIRNLKESTLDAQAQFVSKGESVDRALVAVLHGKPLPSGLTKLGISKDVECIVRLGAQFPLQLYNRAQAQLRAFTATHIKPLLVPRFATSGRDAQGFAELVLSTWSNWLRTLHEIRELLSFLDQAYCRRTSEKGVCGIIKTGAQAFQESIAHDGTLRTELIAGVLASVDRRHDLETRSRDGHKTSEQRYLRGQVEMMQHLGIYRPFFEDAYLAAIDSRLTGIQSAIQREPSRAFSSRRVQALLNAETNRAKSMSLEELTARQILDLVTVQLIDNIVPYWTEQQPFNELVVDGDLPVLASIYDLFARNGLEDQLANVWGEACLAAGRAILDKSQEDVVSQLLELKDSLDKALTTSFKNRQTHGLAMRRAFEIFMNEQRKGEAWATNNSKIAEMIAKYVDRLLREGPKAIKVRVTGQLADMGDDGADDPLAQDDDKALEKALDLGLDLFRFVRGKDVFEAFYKKDLAKRLLLNRSASDTAEKYMMDVLRKECGESFTHNLEEMFKDIALAKETNAGFRGSRGSGAVAGGGDLVVQALSSAAWPTYSDLRLALPSAIQSQLEDYEKFYKSRHRGRSLAWRHLMSHAILRANFSKGGKELQVSALQAVVLLTFAELPDGGVLDYNQIAGATQLEGPQLIRTLQSLACGKFKVLKKSSKGPDIKESDRFMVNPDFSHANFRLKINQIQVRETEQENKETHERIASDRQFEIQAAIVRVMKAKQLITHNELVTEVIQALSSRGSIQISEIKANIEKLIDKEYLEREGPRYKYIT